MLGNVLYNTRTQRIAEAGLSNIRTSLQLFPSISISTICISITCLKVRSDLQGALACYSAFYRSSFPIFGSTPSIPDHQLVCFPSGQGP